MNIDEKKATARKLHTEGKTYQTIADVIGCSVSSAHYYINGDNRKSRQKPPKAPPAPAAEPVRESVSLLHHLKSIIDRHGLPGEYNHVFKYMEFLRGQTEW